MAVLAFPTMATTLMTYAGQTDAEALTSATKDTAGRRNTLAILRGVAADGKDWITRQSQ